MKACTRIRGADREWAGSACGMPLREGEGDVCWVCDLLAMSSQEVRDDDSYRDTEPDPGFREIHRERQQKRWRGHRTEANAYVETVTHSEVEATLAATFTSRDIAALFGRSNIKAIANPSLRAWNITVVAGGDAELLVDAIRERRRRRRHIGELDPTTWDAIVERARLVPAYRVGHTAREVNETIARIRHWGERIHVDARGCTVLAEAVPIGLDDQRTAIFPGGYRAGRTALLDLAVARGNNPDAYVTDRGA